jgi:hypothetical protein
VSHSPIVVLWASSELDDVERTRTLLAAAFAERASPLCLQSLPCFRRVRGEPLMEDLARRLLGPDANLLP